MREFIEDKGTWCGIPLILQGVFLNGKLEAFKIQDENGENLSWAMSDGKPIAGKPPSTEKFKKILKRLYKERKLINQEGGLC